MDVIKNYRNNNGRLIHECFLRLPTKRSNADYYESVKQPIDFMRIQQKIKSDEYETFQQFDDDILLLFGNAIQYYDVRHTPYFHCCCCLNQTNLNCTMLFVERIS